LEAAGVRIDLNAEQVADCIREVGVGFMFAPLHHGAMKHAIGPRKEMGVRTIFNLLGPLSNPAMAPNQVLGVFSRDWVEPLARALGGLGSEHVLVVHAEDGLDEISIAAPTLVAELHRGQVTTRTVTPEELGVTKGSLDNVVVDGADASLALIREAFANGAGAPRDIIALNSGAAIYAAGLAENLNAGVARAFDVLASGAAADKLEQLAAFSNSL
jgi:anthranilate phosphoribosyltransferase